MRLYEDLASWWPLLSAPADYEEEAAAYATVIETHSRRRVHAVLELGCGGGNTASHLKTRYRMVLTDVSSGMLEVSRRLNPECEHHMGDMRSLRLGRTFDAVFVHDAVMYMTTIEDLEAAIRTAFEHVEPGGVAVFVPDCIRSTFHPSTSHGGHDGDGRALRYLAWSHDPDPDDHTFVTDFAYLLRQGGDVEVVHDRHVNGLFSRDEWLASLTEQGFDAASVEVDLADPGPIDVFVGRR
jgi:SAM-dependent methyltransferase